MMINTYAVAKLADAATHNVLASKTAYSVICHNCQFLTFPYFLIGVRSCNMSKHGDIVLIGNHQSLI